MKKKIRLSEIFFHFTQSNLIYYNTKCKIPLSYYKKTTNSTYFISIAKYLTNTFYFVKNSIVDTANNGFPSAFLFLKTKYRFCIPLTVFGKAILTGSILPFSTIAEPKSIPFSEP